MNNKTIVIWVSLIVLLTLGIGIIGITKQDELKYIEAKNELKKATKEYIKDNKINSFPITITSETLEEKDYIKEIKIDKNICAADITVAKKFIFNKYKIKFTCINSQK